MLFVFNSVFNVLRCRASSLVWKLAKCFRFILVSILFISQTFLRVVICASLIVTSVIWPLIMIEKRSWTWSLLGVFLIFPTNNLSLYYCAFCWANSWCFVIDISRTIHWKQFEHDPYASTENYSFLLQSSGFCLNTAFSWSGNIWSIWKCMVRSLPSSPMSYGCCLYFPFSRSDNTASS